MGKGRLQDAMVWNRSRARCQHGCLLSAIGSNSREGRVLRLASLLRGDRATVGLGVLVILLLRREEGVSSAGGRLPGLRRPLTAAVCAVGTTVASIADPAQLLDILEHVPMDDD